MIVVAGLWRPMGRWVAAIPTPLASAMLAGVLLGLCLAPVRAVVESNMKGINLEDVGVVESMQRGRASPGYVDAHFSPYHEGCVHSFEKRIANAVGAGLGLV